MTIFNLYKNNQKLASENEGGAGAPAATADNTDNPQTASTENVLDVLHFDPFKKGDEIPPAASAKGGKTDEAASGEGNEGGASPTPPAKAPEMKQAESAKPAQDDQLQHWKDLAENYKQLAEGATKAPAKAEVKDTSPAYDFNIPDELIGALTGDDPVKFKQGITAYAKGIAMAVHQQMAKHLEAQYNPRFESIPQQIVKVLQMQQEHKTVHDDFYGKYPELNHPNLHQLIKSTGEGVAKELGKQAWDSELRDATAKRVKEVLAVATAAATGGKAPTKAPAKMLGSQGSRPTPPANDDARDIVDTLFGTDN